MPAELMATVTTFLPLILMLVFFYLLIILPDKKRKKKHNEMVAGLEKGDKIISIGGIEGKVVQIKDTTVIIETGKSSENEKSTLTLHKWAIKEVKQSEKA